MSRPVVLIGNRIIADFNKSILSSPDEVALALLNFLPGCVQCLKSDAYTRGRSLFILAFALPAHKTSST